jgi:hypothetical protein
MDVKPQDLILLGPPTSRQKKGEPHTLPARNSPLKYFISMLCYLGFGRSRSMQQVTAMVLTTALPASVPIRMNAHV